jgi:hypothetical protein
VKHVPVLDGAFNFFLTAGNDVAFILLDHGVEILDPVTDLCDAGEKIGGVTDAVVQALASV